MYGICLTCGIEADLEAHHVAGHHNHELVIPVCVDCHRILSVWQQAAGTELRDGVVTAKADDTRALVVGAVHLLQLYAQRHADVTWFPNWLAIQTGRTVSRLLDAIQPPDRAGRWLPDPTVPPVEATPVGWRTVGEVERVREMAALARALGQIVGGVPPIVMTSLTEIVDHPARWVAAFDRAVQDQAYLTALTGVVTNYLELSRGMLSTLLQLDNLNQLDDSLLDEIAAWMDSAHHLLDLMCALTVTETEMAS